MYKEKCDTAHNTMDTFHPAVAKDLADAVYPLGYCCYAHPEGQKVSESEGPSVIMHYNCLWKPS